MSSAQGKEQAGSPGSSGKTTQKAWWLASIMTIFAVVGGVVGFWDNLQHIYRELYGPDVVVTVIPQTASSAYGKPDLLYEFRFDDATSAARVRKNDDVKALFSSRPLPIGKFSCGSGNAASLTGGDYYELNIGIQNLGWQTAKGYSVAITFSGDTRPDPGVRIVYAGSDGLDISYLYQQEPHATLPSCLMNDIAAKRKGNEADSGTAGKSPEAISELARRAYKQIGLSRDMVILKGNLEAQLFQTINLLVRIPPGLKKFAVIYNVECANCRHFFRTESFAQIVQPL